MKFSLDWLDDFVDVEASGGIEGVRRLLEQAGIPIESVDGRGGDAILEAEITPNRPDAMGHRGLAREIAAMAGRPMREFAARYAEPDGNGETTEQLTSIVIAFNPPVDCQPPKSGRYPRTPSFIPRLAGGIWPIAVCRSRA